MQATVYPAPLAVNTTIGLTVSQRAWSSPGRRHGPHRRKLGKNIPLSVEDGLVLYHHPDLHEVGAATS